MQRGDEPRVSDPVIEPIQATAPLGRVIALPRRVSMTAVEEQVTAAYDAYAERLRAFAIAAVRDGDLADDLVQESFLRLVAELKLRRAPDNVGGWLYRVCANLVVSGGRRRSVADRMRSLLVRRDVGPSPEQEAMIRERDRTLAIALSRLTPDERVALLLAARGMSAMEIGLVVRRTPLATRTFLFRARVKLRDVLRSMGIEGSQ